MCSPSTSSLFLSLPPAPACTTKMKPPSLLDLATKTVCDNIDIYDQKYIKIGFEPLRTKILLELFQQTKKHYLTCDGRENHNNKQWATLPYLINSKFYTKLNTRQLVMYWKGGHLPHNAFEEFLLDIASLTLNLKELKVHPRFRFEELLSKREMASIIRLKNLANLEFNNVCVPLSGILLISRRCENLEKIRASQVTIDADLLWRSYKNDFVYVCIEALNEYPGQISLTMETTMPAPDSKYAAGTHCVKMHLSPTRIQAFLLTLRFQQKLKEILFDTSNLEDNEEMDEFPHLPEIKYATIDCGNKSAHALRCFMQSNGQNLLELALEKVDIKEKLSLGEIFRLCPNLRALYLRRCTLFGDRAPVDAMQHLKRFIWVNDAATVRAGGVGQSTAEVAIAFSSILSAPLMEELHISLPRIDFRDNATVIARIKRREILRNLKILCMEYTLGNAPEIPPEIHPLYLKRFNKLKNACLSASLMDQLNEPPVFEASNRRCCCILS